MRYKKFPGLVVLLFLSFVFAGCATTLKTSPTYPQVMGRTKTIAVMPPDIHVYQLTAGGVREEMDEWNQQAKEFIQEKLKMHLAERFGIQIKFIEEDWLKTHHRDLWQAHRGLFNAISMSALQHAYFGPDVFATKSKNFDYTFGAELSELAAVCGADALLFLYGFDYEATMGRKIMSFWAAIGGVVLLNPSAMVMGLADGATGDVVWFKTSPLGTEYSFKNKENIGTLIEWLTRNLLKEK